MTDAKKKRIASNGWGRSWRSRASYKTPLGRARMLGINLFTAAILLVFLPGEWMNYNKNNMWVGRGTVYHGSGALVLGLFETIILLYSIVSAAYCIKMNYGNWTKRKIR